MKQSTLFFILYDSITNSVFNGQILQPLLRKKKENPSLTIIIISFEKKELYEKVQDLIKQIHEITFRILPKPLYFHPWSLYPSIKELRKLFKKIKPDSIIARGPLAGYSALKACITPQAVLVQARGILPEEYSYTHQQQKNYLKKLLHYVRAGQYRIIEKAVYSKHALLKFSHTIEVVSEALKQHLITTYASCPNQITLAMNDIPKPIDASIIKAWRASIRVELNIHTDHHVLCYNGSLKPWQCPDKVIEYFIQYLNKNNKAFLLILSHEAEIFENFIKNYNIQPQFYRCLAVNHTEIYHYLAACDAGIIFREKNIINWVSRPTKILEYQVVGLPIIHNNTIGILSCP